MALEPFSPCLYLIIGESIHCKITKSWAWFNKIETQSKKIVPNTESEWEGEGVTFPQTSQYLSKMTNSLEVPIQFITIEIQLIGSVSDSETEFGREAWGISESEGYAPWALIVFGVDFIYETNEVISNSIWLICNWLGPFVGGQNSNWRAVDLGSWSSEIVYWSEPII